MAQAIAELLDTDDHQITLFDLNNPPFNISDGLIIVAPSTIDERFFHQLLTVSQQLVPRLSRPGFYLTISRIDGRFGLGQQPSSVVSAGLSAFTKTVAREFPDIFCRCLDIANDCNDYRKITTELLFASQQEIGHDGTTSGYLKTTKVLASPVIEKFPDDQLFLFTGGGRGITYRLAGKFLAQTNNQALLIGSSAVPEQQPLPKLIDEPTIKRQLMLAHPRLTPRNIEAKYRAILKNHQLHHNISELEKLYGKRLSYRQVDVCDRQAVAELADQPITGIVHGAGLLQDRLLTDLTIDNFQRVYAPKVHGLQNLLEHIDPSRLQYLVLFSSLTARYGRKGQLAYAVANDILNKQGQQLNQRYPQLKVVAFNFGPWQGGGMVNSQLERIFADEGLGLIPQESTELCLKEIFATDNHTVERLMLVETPSTTRLLNYNLNEQPLLNSHRINNKIVLPLALIIDQICRYQQTTTLQQTKVLNAVSFSGCYQLQLQRNNGDITLTDHQQRARYRATLVANQLPAQTTAELTIDNCKLVEQNLYGTDGLLFHGKHFQLLNNSINTDHQGTGLQTKVKLSSDDKLIIYAIDVLLQLAIVYGYHKHQSLSLPMAIDYYCCYRQPQTSVNYTATLIGREQRQSSMICDAELSCGTDLYLRLQGIDMIFLTS